MHAKYKTLKKHNKLPKKIDLPPKTFNINHYVPRGLLGRTRQWVRIKLDSTKSPKSSKQILYFNVILMRQTEEGKWEWIASFDTYHKEKQYPHGHRRIGLTTKKEDIRLPRFANHKDAIEWVYRHLDKNWRNYVRMHFKDKYRIEREEKKKGKEKEKEK